MIKGQRIRYFRNLRGLTPKELGIQMGFSENTADVRIAQYESGTRKPKAEMTAALAQALGVAPQSLTVPDIDSGLGLIHTLFALEDLYGIKVERIDGRYRLCFDEAEPITEKTFYEALSAWAEQSEKHKNGEISKEQYDMWRYNYNSL